MHRNIKMTEDGSHTIYVPQLNENYHSMHGALSESKHIFIESAFNYCAKEELRVLEIGFGTGLNALLTFDEASRKKRRLYYHGVEKFPLSLDEVSLLNYDSLINHPGISILDFHRCPWEKPCQISPSFVLHKEQSDIRNLRARGLFDLIYFDAFDPGVQADVWCEEVFIKIAKITAPGGILTTYSVKGDVKRALKAAGFKVEKIPGPYGKREILRAVKP